MRIAYSRTVLAALRTRNWTLGVVLAVGGLASSVQAQSTPLTLYGVQPGTGKIVQVNPATGAVGAGYTAPGNLLTTQTSIGLSGAENSQVLIYRNAQDTGGNSNTIYRLNAATGAVLSTATADSYNDDGLSFESISGVNYIYSSHSGTDVHRQTNYGGSYSLFFTAGAPVGGLGGDGLGREFGNYTDGFIREFNPSTGVILNTFNAPSTSIQGLAFDGTFVYASNAAGRLYTLNASTGAVVADVAVSGGALYGLGTAVPEPAMAGLALTLAGGLLRRVRRR